MQLCVECKYTKSRAGEKVLDSATSSSVYKCNSMRLLLEDN